MRGTTEGFDKGDFSQRHFCNYAAAIAMFASAGASTAAATAATAGAAAAGAAAASGAAVGSLAAIPAVSAATMLGSTFSLSTIFSIGSGIAQIAGGLMEGKALDAEAKLESIRAQQELLIGQQDIINEKELLIENLASFNAAQGAAGVDTGSGSVQVAKNAAIKDQEFQTDITRTGARIRSLTRRGSAAAMRSRATGARIGGLAGALQTGFQQSARTTARGA